MKEKNTPSDKTPELKLTTWFDPDTGSYLITKGVAVDAEGHLMTAEPLFTDKGELGFGIRFNGDESERNRK